MNVSTDDLATQRWGLLQLDEASTPTADNCLWGGVTVVLAVLAVATWHWRGHAIGSIAIPPSVPALPGSKPLLGHAWEVLRNLHRVHHWLLEKSHHMVQGKTFAFSLPFLPTYFVVTDPKCLEHMLKARSDNYEKGHMFIVKFKPLLGRGIFTSDGEQWLWQRKLATHIFNVKSFKQYIDVVFNGKIQLLHAVLLRSNASGGEVDLHDLMHRFTLDAFARLAFGVDPGSLSSEGKPPFAAAFDRAQAICVSRFWLPAWPLLELLDGRGAQIRRCSSTVKRFALDVIQQRRQQRRTAAEGTAAAAAAPSSAAGHGDASALPDAGADAGAEAQDLLSLFMSACGPDDRPLTDSQLVDTVLNFIIAGRDTTAQALSWTFFLLMQHPEVEAKLLAEVQEVMGAAAATTSPEGYLKPSYDQLRVLHYARACFLEALRLYPSIPMDVKFAVQQDVLPDGSVIPKRAQVVYPPFVVNRLTSFWGADAESFRPERWLHMEHLPSPYNYLSFNAGPRICLGQRLAELEGVYVLVSLLSRFKFTPVAPLSQVTYYLSTTLPMKGGLRVRVEDRGRA